MPISWYALYMDKPKRAVGRPSSKFDLGKALKLRMKGLSYQDIGILVGASKVTVEGKIRPLLMALGAPEQILSLLPISDPRDRY